MKPAKKLSLPVWIFIGMLAGILAGLCFLKNPDFTTNYLKPIGTIYISVTCTIAFSQAIAKSTSFSQF